MRKNLITNAALYLYMGLLSLVYYNFCATGSTFTSVYISTSDMERFFNLFTFGEETALSVITIKNIVYTFLLFFTKDSFFSFVWTSFLLYLVSVFLVYKISNLCKQSNFYGLLAVLIFTTIPEMFLRVYAVNVHISETMLLLAVVWFYGKSESFSVKKYSILYLVFALVAFFERESIVIYLGIIIVLSSYICLKRKKHASCLYNVAIAALIAAVIFSSNHSSYVFERLSHWVTYFKSFESDLIWKIPYLTLCEIFFQLVKGLSGFYLSVLFLAFCVRIFNSAKKKESLFLFIEIFISCVFALYFLTVIPKHRIIFREMFDTRGAVLDDILPIFAFLSVFLANFFYTYRKNIKYLVCTGLVLFFIFPLNLFDYSLTAFRDKEKAILADKVSYEYLHYDISSKVETAIDSGENNGFFFILKKSASSSSDSSYSISIPYLSVMDIFEDMFSFVEDVFCLKGFKSVYVHEEKAKGLISKTKVSPQDVYASFVSYLANAFTHILSSDKITLIADWKIIINNQPCNLMFYALKAKD